MIDKGIRERKGVFGFSLFSFHRILSPKGERDLSDVRKQIQEKAGL
jgi:hypothetical protein